MNLYVMEYIVLSFIIFCETFFYIQLIDSIDLTQSEYLGCWPDYSLAVRNQRVVYDGDLAVLETCRNDCIANSYNFFILRDFIGTDICECDCGNFTSQTGQYEPLCYDESSMKCGRSGMYGVYNASGNSTASTAASTTSSTGATQSTSASTSAGHATSSTSTSSTGATQATSASTSAAAGQATSSTSTTSPSPDCQCCPSTQITYLTFEDLTPEQQQQITEIKKNLTLDITSLSSYIRSKSSAKDDRPTAKGIGSIGILMLVLIFGTIVLMDVDKIIIGTKDIIEAIKQAKEWAHHAVIIKQNSTRVEKIKPQHITESKEENVKC